jgi:small subunit ribosomal protein S20e
MSQHKAEDKKKDVEIAEQSPLQKYTVTVSFTKVKPLETLCANLVKEARIKQANADGVEKVQVRGPVRMPTKRLKLCTRKSPCGNGTNTYDHWEMRIHKRVFHINASQESIMEIIGSLKYDSGIRLEIVNEEEE